MKFEIDLNEILQDEYGPTENLAQSIKRQVVENLTAKMTKGIQAKIDEEVNAQISETVTAAIQKKLPNFTDELVDLEYTPVDNYGRKSPPTTLRNELIKTLQEQMQYKPKTFSSDKNYFTKAIDEICDSKLSEWKKDFSKMVDEMFAKKAFDYAVKEMQKKLGLKV